MEEDRWRGGEGGGRSCLGTPGLSESRPLIVVRVLHLPHHPWRSERKPSSPLRDYLRLRRGCSEPPAPVITDRSPLATHEDPAPVYNKTNKKSSVFGVRGSVFVDSLEVNMQ